MSESQRSRLYDWLREQAGEEPAEYLMSCIASVPLSELATKDSVETLKGRVERLETVCVGLDAKFEADRARRDAHRDADRAEAAKRHRLLVAAAILLGAEIVVAEAGWLGWFTDLLASAV